MNIEDTLAPNSDQLDAIELVAGPRIFTITKVSKGNPEQPVEVSFAEFPRVWRPSKSMRRVLAGCWGSQASVWSGRRCELFYDPTVTFGRETPGGTRISRLSHIDGTQKIPLIIGRGKSAMYTVEPLPDAEPTSPAVSNETLIALDALFEEAQIPDDARLAGVNAIIRGAATALEVLTEDQAQTVLASLRKKVGR